jgi:hypothetical protein
MERARPLRDVFSDLVGTDSAGTDHAGPAEVLRASGHPDLPDTLVAEAVGSYADTAPIEVAEHLSPYVMAHSPVPQVDAPEADPAGWFDAVATAPAADLGADPLGGLDDLADVAHVAGPADAPAAADPGHDLAFGHGSASGADPAGGLDPTGTYEHDTVDPDHAGDPGLDAAGSPAADDLSDLPDAHLHDAHLHDASDLDDADDGDDAGDTDPSWLDG